MNNDWMEEIINEYQERPFLKEGDLVLGSCGYAEVYVVSSSTAHLITENGVLRRTQWKVGVKSLNDLTFYYFPDQLIQCTINDMSDKDKVLWITKRLV